MTITHDYVAYATGNDYKGSTFTDGSFANATLTLTKAGAFAATKVNHWLYLDDNGSGEVTTGYYRVTSIAGAPNAVVLHADIRSGANDPTDVKCTQHDGTTSLPWRTDQGAVDLCTRNATDGNQVNILAGVAVVHAAALDLATFIAGGALAAAAPLILRGYTSAANDGGIGEIDCGGATMFAATTYDYIRMIDLECHSFGDNNGIYLDSSCLVFRVTAHKGASSPSGKIMIYGGTSTQVIGCYVYDVGAGAAKGISGCSRSIIAYNYVNTGTLSDASLRAIDSGSPCQLIGNIVKMGGVAGTGIFVYAPGTIIGNLVYNSAAGTGSGIRSFYGNELVTILNNILVGFSGAGGEGVLSNNGFTAYGYNAFYNCTANYTPGDVSFIDLTANDVSLAADPFTDAANGDFSLTDAGKAALRSLGWPAAYLGAHANTDPHITIGPLQYGPTPAAAGGGFPILGGSVVR